MSSVLPDIPRLYTALAEWLACLLFLLTRRRRFGGAATAALSAGVLALLAVFLQATGDAPLVLWFPCMVVAILLMYGYLYAGCALDAFAAGYCCAQAFLLAELAASVEWQLFCWLLLGQRAFAPLPLALLALTYAAVFGFFWRLAARRSGLDEVTEQVGPKSLVTAVIMALTAFGVSNLSFALRSAASMSVFSTRTLVDLAGVLILNIQQEQMREDGLHRELEATANVLRRQYEQYQQSRENIHLLNRRYHDLKVQIAAIRTERDPGRQAAALDRMADNIRMFEAENKTGNAVLDTVLTTKNLYCTQHGINFTCVADGHLLDFLPTMDLCTIVGVALDNAIERVNSLSDPEKKLVRTAVFAQNGFVMLRFENYYEGETRLGADGLPLGENSGPGGHGGYGLKGIRTVAQKYGGTMTVHAEDHWVVVRVLLPLQRKG